MNNLFKKVLIALVLLSTLIALIFLIQLPQAGIPPSQSLKPQGYHVLFQTLKNMGFKLSPGLSLPNGDKNIFILAENVDWESYDKENGYKNTLDLITTPSTIVFLDNSIIPPIENFEIYYDDDAELDIIKKKPANAKVIYDDEYFGEWLAIPYKNSQNISLKLIIGTESYQVNNESLAKSLTGENLKSELQKQFDEYNMLTSSNELISNLSHELIPGSIAILERPVEKGQGNTNQLVKDLPDAWPILIQALILGLIFFWYAGPRFGPIIRKRSIESNGLSKHLEAVGGFLKNYENDLTRTKLEKEWYEEEIRTRNSLVQEDLIELDKKKSEIDIIQLRVKHIKSIKEETYGKS